MDTFLMKCNLFVELAVTKTEVKVSQIDEKVTDYEKRITTLEAMADDYKQSRWGNNIIVNMYMPGGPPWKATRCHQRRFDPETEFSRIRSTTACKELPQLYYLDIARHHLYERLDRQQTKSDSLHWRSWTSKRRPGHTPTHLINLQKTNTTNIYPKICQKIHMHKMYPPLTYPS